MSHVRDVTTVAAWEFRRYFKWKDQIVTLLFFVLVSGLGFGAAIVGGAKGRIVTVALSGFEMQPPRDGRIRFVPAAGSEAARLAALQRGDVQGILTRRPGDAFELLVGKDPRYKAELVSWLGETVRRERLAASGLSTQGLERILAAASLEVRFTDPAAERRGRAEKIAAGVLTGVLLLAVFTSLAYLMTGITGEKQLRVTESVVSAISPQAWIDGKVLGIAGYSLVVVLNMAVGGAILAFAAYLASGFTLPPAAVRPAVVVALVAFTVLGLLLWNSFFAAVASTIDDPNTSSRASLLFLPLLPVLMSMAVLRDPDSLLSRGLALCPLTSAPALPMRLVLSDPGVPEVGAALALLVAAIWIMRRIAGRIFRVGMLLYGKEPTLREIARWVSE